MNKFNVGDRVWCCMFGWGEVTRRTNFLLYVKFDKSLQRHAENIVVFTPDGKYSSDDLKPILFHDEVKDWPNPPKQFDWTKVPVDTPVWVRQNNDEHWVERHFSNYKNDKFYCWDDGKTSHTEKYKTNWKEYSLTKPE